MTNTLQPQSVVEINDPDLVRWYASGMRISVYIHIAFLTSLIYHSAITFDKEVKYIWSRPGSSISLIYFATRYLGLLSAVCNMTYGIFAGSTASCQFSGWAGSISSFVTTVLIDYILMIRVLALYQQDKRLSICLKCLLGLGSVIGLGLLIYIDIRQDIVSARLAKVIPICLNNDALFALTIICWVIPMIYGLVLLCLVLRKAAQYWRMSDGFKESHLAHVLVQDQLIYYCFVVLCCVLKIVGLSIGKNPAARALQIATSPTLFCVLGGQLLINLMEAGEKGLNGGTNNTLRSVSEIKFARSDRTLSK